MAGAQYYTPGSIKLNPKTGQHEDAQGNQFVSSGAQGWYSPKAASQPYQRPARDLTPPPMPRSGGGVAGPSSSPSMPASIAPMAAAVEAPNAPAPVSAPLAVSTPKVDPPKEVEGPESDPMAPGAGAHAISGPVQGRGGIGSRMPPSLAALLKVRVY